MVIMAHCVSHVGDRGKARCTLWGTIMAESSCSRGVKRNANDPDI